MAEQSEKVPIHPIAPRLKNGLKKPHIGSDIQAYREAHKESVGHESDKWWAEVCTIVDRGIEFCLIMLSKLAISSTGIALLTL